MMLPNPKPGETPVMTIMLRTLLVLGYALLGRLPEYSRARSDH